MLSFSIQSKSKQLNNTADTANVFSMTHRAGFSQQKSNELKDETFNS